MGIGGKRTLVVAAASLLGLTACETTSTKLPDFLASASTSEPAAGQADDPAATGTVFAPVGPPLEPSGQAVQPVPPLTPSNPADDLSIGKTNFRQGNYGLAERYFRRAVEAGPRDAEAWLGLAATYDRLKRFDLAERAYQQLMQLLGHTPEVLNNYGYSYMLRGEFARARQILAEAQAKDPGNPYIRNNIVLLETSARDRKAIR
jgi:tetratricopeptide (TPR) repeat protein